MPTLSEPTKQAYRRGREAVTIHHPDTRAEAWGSLTVEQARDWMTAEDDADGATKHIYSDTEAQAFCAGVRAALAAS